MANDDEYPTPIITVSSHVQKLFTDSSGVAPGNINILLNLLLLTPQKEFSYLVEEVALNLLCSMHAIDYPV